MEKGYVHVYTGDGKGKTTVMLGLALRAYGAGLKIYIGQFIKTGGYSEIKAIKENLPLIDIEQYGTGFMRRTGKTEDAVKAAQDGLLKAAAALSSGRYDLVMLDEINMAVHHGLVSVEDALRLIA